MRKLGFLMALVALAALGLMARAEAPALAADPDTAKMSLVAKPAGGVNVLVKNTFTISVRMDQISMVDRDADTVGGYTGWQAKVTFPSGLKLVGNPNVVWPQKDQGTTLSSATDTSVLVGSTVGLDAQGNLNQESTHIGNLVQLTLSCNEPDKAYIVTLESALVLAEPNPGPPPTSKTAKVTIAPSSVNVDCRAAAMSVAMKSGAAPHFQDPATGQFHVKVGSKFTVNVQLDDIRNLIDKDVPPDGGGYTQIVAVVEYDNTKLKVQTDSIEVPNCSTELTENKAVNQRLLGCTSFPAEQSFESEFTGTVFSVTFTCNSAGKSQLSLLPGQTKLVDENGADVNVFTGSEILINCIDLSDDKDSDNCTHAQEIANGTDPNRYDFWDTNGDQNVDIVDVFNYLLRFGQQPDPPPPANTKVNDTTLPPDNVINILDIGDVIAQFGLSCKP